jgi:hypothetical protein
LAVRVHGAARLEATRLGSLKVHTALDEQA